VSEDHRHLDPLPQTDEALAEIATDDLDELREGLRDLGRLAGAIVPELVGISVTLVQEGLTFTLASSGENVAGIDATQYLDGGPCLWDDDESDSITTEISELLRDETWVLFARASLASGVASTLSLPVRDHGEVIGGINLYASAPGAFSGRSAALAAALGASAEGALTDADLSFSSRGRAAAAPHQLRERHELDVAAGILAARYRETIADAADWLANAAARADLSPGVVARLVIDLHTSSGR
jgi:GAF domain-containing protein